MKNFVTLCSVLILTVIVGCNRGQNQPTPETRADRQKQQGRPGESLGFEKEEYREGYQPNQDTNVTTPIDERPDLEEEMNN